VAKKHPFELHSGKTHRAKGGKKGERTRVGAEWGKRERTDKIPLSGSRITTMTRESGVSAGPQGSPLLQTFLDRTKRVERKRENTARRKRR